MDDLLAYYNRELSYLRNLGAEFAEKHPKIAGRLRLSGEQIEDPHVSRMIESFALLTARIRRKVDDDFPLIAEAMLDVLYPHFGRPFPSVCITQLALGKATWATTEPHRVERGVGVETDPIDGEPCRFRTCYPVDLWPITVAEAQLAAMPTRAPVTRFSVKSGGVARLRLETLSPKVKPADLPIDSLRFFLHGQSLHTTGLYELLLNGSLGVAVASESGEHVVTLPPGSLTAVGFGAEEGLVDYDARSFLGYRLLTELHSLQEKFLFIDLRLGPEVLRKVGDGGSFEIFVYLKDTIGDLERNVDASTFRLGCTPIANLFTVRAEPIRLTGEESEYRVTPDARRTLSHEVVSIDRVVVSDADHNEVEASPLYSTEHRKEFASRTFWHARRQASSLAEHRVDHGTEVYVSPVDLGGEIVGFDGGTLDVTVTCCNRDLPSRLPFGGGQPCLRLAAGATAEATCLTPPTPTLRPNLGQGAAWRLVSKLSVNHASLVSDATTLRELLGLYDLVDSESSRVLTESLTGVSSRRVVRRVGTQEAAFCRGVEVTITLDEDRLNGGERYLFASVLDRFFGLYASINSFTTTRVMTNRMASPLCQWPPRTGNHDLV